MREIVENISSRQLLTVFRLCDPEETGRVKIERLQSLAEIYANDGDDVDTQVRNFPIHQLDCWCDFDLSAIAV